MSWVSSGGDGVFLNIHLVPRASRSEVIGPHGDALKIRIKSPPVDGRANRALTGFIAERLHVSDASVTIVGGAANRRKRLHVRGVDETEARRLLSPS